VELPAGVTTDRALGRISPQPHGARCWFFHTAVAVIVLLLSAGASRGGEIVADYTAYWAGLPAAEIRLRLHDAADAYQDEIEIRSEGLPRLVAHFHGTARADGSLSAGRPAAPSRYDALYDLRKRRNSLVSMRFVAHGDAIVAERGPRDTSRKPPLAEPFRRNTVDPITALERIRGAVAARDGASSGGRFSIPVYDGARRFDVVGHILPKAQQADGTVQVELALRPIAGFKGESSDDGDPDDAPRPVALTLSDDARLMPLSMTVRMFYLPLVVRLDRLCTEAAGCSAAQHAAGPSFTPETAAQRQ
jgi:hypothetical protein